MLMSVLKVLKLSIKVEVLYSEEEFPFIPSNTVISAED